LVITKVFSTKDEKNLYTFVSSPHRQLIIVYRKREETLAAEPKGTNQMATEQEQYLEGFVKQAQDAINNQEYPLLRSMARQLFHYAEDLEMSQPYDEEVSGDE
jgi:hypothetical protein